MRQARLSWTESTRQPPGAAKNEKRRGGVSAAEAQAQQGAANRGPREGTAWSDGSQSYESDAAESITTSEAERITSEYENRQIAEEMDSQVQEALLAQQQAYCTNVGELGYLGAGEATCTCVLPRKPPMAERVPRTPQSAQRDPVMRSRSGSPSERSRTVSQPWHAPARRTRPQNRATQLKVPRMRRDSPEACT